MSRLEGGEFVRLVRAENEKFVKLQLTPLKSASSSLFRDWKALIVSNGFSSAADAWNRERLAAFYESHWPAAIHWAGAGRHVQSSSTA